MRRIWLITFVFLFSFVLSACTSDKNGTEDNPVFEEPIELNIYFLNDLHGALLEGDGEMGMARIGNFLLSEKVSRPEKTIILGGGDMVQGTLFSNYFHGENTTRIMDEVGFDATALGNHEFDWGLDQVTRYYDGSEDVYQASHKLLGANVFYKGTETIPSGIEPYIIIERSGLSIGIIGTIGYGLESSILAPMVADYEFAAPTPIVEDYARMLRSEKDVDVVLLLTHDVGSNFYNLNHKVSQLPDDAKIDAVFNGHSHRTETEMRGMMPTIMSGSSGSHIGLVKLVYEAGAIIDASAENLGPEADFRLTEGHGGIQAIMDEYMLEIEHLYEPVLPAARSISRTDLSEWMSTLMLIATGADIAFQNSGGTRDSFYHGEQVSIARLYDVFPFDNTVVRADVPGHLVLNLMDGNPHYAMNVDAIDANETYTIATNNYIFLRESNNLVANSTNIEFLDLEMFDLAIEALLQMADVYEAFSTDHPILIGPYETWHYEEDTP